MSESRRSQTNRPGNPQKAMGDAWRRSPKKAKAPPALPHTGKGRRQTAQEKHKRKCTFGETTDKVGFQSSTGRSPFAQDDIHKPEKGKELYKPGLLSLIFGVAMPALALVVETNTHVMARAHFDPFPSLAHVFLFLLIPLSNFLLWLAARRNLSSLYSMLALSCGMSLGITILYSIMFMPTTPEALFTFKGLGFLAVAPAIIVTFLNGNTICQLADAKRTFFDAHQLKHLGHLIILVMVVVVELPSTLTRLNLGLASSGTVEQQKSSLDWLRAWGDRDVLLRACYERSGKATDILGSLAEHARPVPIEQARQVYYKVTGVAFNAVPIPSGFRGTIQHAGLIDDPAGLNADVKDEFDLDPDIAGELVSGVARGLSVSQSAISGSVKPDLASLDWDFTFENVSDIPREARAKILLPPGAVVTKATLWLDDYMKETTIMSRGLARETYQMAVKEHKQDPLLVSMAGKDTVLVQCYPVAKGIKTRIRLHIVSPTEPLHGKDSALVLPTFDERNFAITIPHKIALTSAVPLEVSGLNSDGGARSSGRSFTAGGTIENSVLARFSAIAHLKPGFHTGPVKSESASEVVYPRQAPGDNANLKRDLNIVIDQSVTMQPYMADIIAALKTTPDDVAITLIAARDGSQTLVHRAPSSATMFTDAIDTLQKNGCHGGHCNASAVEQAMQSGLSISSDTLWIHAAQPVVDNAGNTLHFSLSNPEPNASRLFDLQVASGPNAVLNDSFQYVKLNRVPRAGSLKEDLERFLASWRAGEFPSANRLYAGDLNNASLSAEQKQLAAYNLANDLYLRGDRMRAYAIAQQFHIVTPVSSAVVVDEDMPELKIRPLSKAKGRAQMIDLDSLNSQLQSLSQTAGSADDSSMMPQKMEMDMEEAVSVPKQLAEKKQDYSYRARQSKKELVYPSSPTAASPKAAPEPTQKPMRLRTEAGTRFDRNEMGDKSAAGGIASSPAPLSMNMPFLAAQERSLAAKDSKTSTDFWSAADEGADDQIADRGARSNSSGYFETFSSQTAPGEEIGGAYNSYANSGTQSALSVPGSGPTPILQGATNGTVGPQGKQLEAFLKPDSGFGQQSSMSCAVSQTYGANNGGEPGYLRAQSFFLYLASGFALMILCLVALLLGLVKANIGGKASSSWQEWQRRNKS